MSDGFGYYLVEKGQTLYSLTRQLDVPEDTLRKYNTLELANGLKAGSMLRYPVVRENGGEGITIIQDPGQPIVYEDTESKSFDTSKPPHVVLMLPFTGNGRE